MEALINFYLHSNWEGGNSVLFSFLWKVPYLVINWQCISWLFYINGVRDNLFPFFGLYLDGYLFWETKIFSHFHPNNIRNNWDILDVNSVTSFFQSCVPLANYLWFYCWRRRGIIIEGDTSNVTGWSSRQCLLAALSWYDISFAPRLQFHGLCSIC